MTVLDSQSGCRRHFLERELIELLAAAILATHPHLRPKTRGPNQAIRGVHFRDNTEKAQAQQSEHHSKASKTAASLVPEDIPYFADSCFRYSCGDHQGWNERCQCIEGARRCTSDTWCKCKGEAKSSAGTRVESKHRPTPDVDYGGNRHWGRCIKDCCFKSQSLRPSAF